MNIGRRISTSILVSLGLLMLATIAPADNPAAYQIQDVVRTKQLTNYCGPACVTSVLKHYGKKITQEEVGKAVYDVALSATNGADMLYYARQAGFSAYTWNSSLQDVKEKIAAGIPVVVLQQNSMVDTSGHYRVLTGYDDAAGKFTVMDPYYDSITDMSYTQTDRLWRPMGFWALAIIPADKDTFQEQLDAKNPVVHMDLSLAYLKHSDFDKALAEINRALELEPGNRYAMSMQSKIKGAAGKAKK